MFGQIGEIAPKAVLIGGVAYAAINWAWIGPELGARTLHADGHITQCEQSFGKSVLAKAREEMSKIPMPTPDPEKEMAARAIRGMASSPLGTFFTMAGQQAGISLQDTLSVYEDQKRSAKAAYERALKAAKAKTTAKIELAGDFCGCVADAAVSDAQNEFAIYSGTLTLFRPAKIRDLDTLMIRAQAGNACTHIKGDV